MDNQLIKVYGQGILSYRLRSKRQKKRAQEEGLAKQLRRISKEERQLYLQRNNLGWEPLIPPV
jgi:hypothetical protein